MRKWAMTGVVTLAITAATAAGARAQERLRPVSIGQFAWTAGHDPVKCDLAAEFATGALLGPPHAGRRADGSMRRLRDGSDISIEELENGIRRQPADRMGSAAALDALSSVGGQQVVGNFTRVADHER